MVRGERRYAISLRAVGRRSGSWVIQAMVARPEVTRGFGKAVLVGARWLMALWHHQSSIGHGRGGYVLSGAGSAAARRAGLARAGGRLVHDADRRAAQHGSEVHHVPVTSPGDE